MLLTRRPRDGVRRSEITCSVRIWQRPRVKVGRRYGKEDRPELARESGFRGVVDLPEVARHAWGDKVDLVRFHYVPPADPTRRGA